MAFENYITTLYSQNVNMNSFHFSLIGILNCCVAYNVGLPKAKIFSGPSSEQFGYAVQQFINPKGNW